MQQKLFSILHKVFQLVFVAMLFAAPFSQTGSLNTAHALFGAGDSVFVIGGPGTIPEATTAGAQLSILGKEIQLDAIFNALAKTVLQNMTQEIVAWINSGFQGRPAFVTDLGQFLLDSADQTAGQFIYNDPDLNFLCSPFQLDVKIALSASYQESTYDSFASCTLSEVTDNIEGFLSGSFVEGGWESWFVITQEPINTPTGAFLAAEAEMYARIVDSQGNTLRELDWGDGFLSFKVCSETASESGTVQNCDVTTPGRVIADQINKALGAGQDQLIAADEINEIIGALFAQLAQQAITGMYGLLGLSGDTGYTDYNFSNPSGATDQAYLDALDEETNDTEVYLENNPFPQAIADENKYYDLQVKIADDITNVELRRDDEDERYGACFKVVIPNDIIKARDDARKASSTSAVFIKDLESYNRDYIQATTSKDRVAATEVYSNLLSDGKIKNASIITNLEYFVDVTLAAALSDLTAEINSEANRCDN